MDDVRVLADLPYDLCPFGDGRDQPEVVLGRVGKKDPAVLADPELLRERCPRVAGSHAPYLGENSPRPAGYCFSQSRPLNGSTVMLSTVPESRQRAFTLKPSGCERGT